MNEIRLPRGADVGAEEDPCVGPALQVWMTLHVRIYPEMSELVTAQRDEEAVADRFPGSDGANHFQPTGDPAALFTRALPPAAARRHHNDRRQGRVGARDFRRDIECLRSRAADMRNECHAGTRGSPLAQPRSF